MEEYCRTVTFKKCVRDALSERDFLEEFINDLRINAKIQTEVYNQLNKIKEESKHNISKNVLNLLISRVPGIVAKEVLDTLPKYLNDNANMKSILDNHASELQTILQERVKYLISKIDNTQFLLEAEVKKTIDRVVNEDQYHITTNAHCNAITQKGSATIDTFKRDAYDQLEGQIYKFNNELSSMWNSVESTRKELSSDIKKIDELTAEINTIKSDVNKLEWVSVVQTIGLIISLGFLFAKYAK